MVLQGDGVLGCVYGSLNAGFVVSPGAGVGDVGFLESIVVVMLLYTSIKRVLDSINGSLSAHMEQTTAPANLSWQSA
jgi:hypothetical protein